MNLFIALAKLDIYYKHPIKEDTCKFKKDKITYSKLLTLAKKPLVISL